MPRRSRVPPASASVLKPSPSFALSFDFEGRARLTSLVFPYEEAFELPEPHRVLMSFFAGGGTPRAEATDAYLRAHGEARTAENRASVDAVIQGLVDAKLLVAAEEPPSLYTRAMAADYARHRTVPDGLVDWVVKAAGIGRTTRVLDLGCGTGALATGLARASGHVTGMDVSRPFLEAAEAEAARAGVKVRYLQESANNLRYHAETYDVVTCCQAFHWFDPGQATAGILSVLKTGGRFVLLDAILGVPLRHPLATLLRPLAGSPLAPMHRRYERLFQALPHRGRTLRRIRTQQHTEPRSLGLGFARAFLSPEHLRLLQLPGVEDPDRFWEAWEHRLAAVPDRAFQARQLWSGVLFTATPEQRTTLDAHTRAPSAKRSSRGLRPKR